MQGNLCCCPSSSPSPTPLPSHAQHLLYHSALSISCQVLLQMFSFFWGMTRFPHTDLFSLSLRMLLVFSLSSEGFISIILCWTVIYSFKSQWHSRMCLDFTWEDRIHLHSAPGKLHGKALLENDRAWVLLGKDFFELLFPHLRTSIEPLKLWTWTWNPDIIGHWF